MLTLSGGLVALSGLGAVPARAATTRSIGAFPVTVHAANGTVTLAVRPARIISLSPTGTEDLFAIGAGHEVIAVDNDSDYPPNAPRTSLSGFSPNVEAIAHDRPDLVLIDTDVGGLVGGLRKLRIPVLVEPAAADLNQAYAELSLLGAATGHVTGAAKAVASMKSGIATAVKNAPRFATPPTYYYELDRTYYSVTSSTFIGRVLALFGLRNVADAAKGAAAAGGYPQLSAEYVLAANPDFVFLADTLCCGQSSATVSARPGWSHVNAVVHHSVVRLNDDIASRWGPRIVTLADDVEQALWARKRQS
jgi:iron complex transport system substrate-binding protein